MTKNRPNPPQREIAAPRKNGRPALVIRILVSIFLLWHLAAVTMAPLSIALSTYDAFPFEVALTQRPPIQWYLDALYLNHGYSFFAPDPGEGHLIRYEVFDERGGVMKRGEFPNTKDQWPRLRYHRYFMLADQAQLPLGSEKDREHWQRMYLESYAQELLREIDGGQMIRLQRIAHYPLLPQHALEGRKLDDPATYKVMMTVEQRRNNARPPVDVRPPATDQSRIWQGQGGRTDTAGRWTGGVR